MIEVDGLTRHFGETVAVAGVRFEARAGEILGVLGPNGAGKTTTLRMLCGYLAPSSGTARVAGFDVVERSLEVRRRIGYLPENVPLYPEMKVDEYLAFRAGLKGVARGARAGEAARTARLCGLAPVTRATIGTLSKGYRQRVGLADALLGDPPVLVLDEPTAGLDPNQAHDVRDLVRELAGTRTILLSSHILGEVEQVCDRVVIFRRGRIVAEGAPRELSTRVAARETVTVEFDAAHREAMAAACGAVATVTALEELPDGWLRATLEAARDPREDVFRSAAAAGATLRELTRRTLSLEEVFHELTLGEEPTMMPGDGGAEEGA